MKSVYPLLLVAAVLLSGCATMLTPRLSQDASANAPSLDTWLQHAPVDILIVHGIDNFPFGQLPNGDANYLTKESKCTNYGDLVTALGSADYQSKPAFQKLALESARKSQFDDFITETARQLGYTEQRDAKSEKLNLLRYPPTSKIAGYYFRREFKGPGRPLRFYVVNWALSACVQKEASYGLWNVGKNPDGRYNEFDPDLARFRSHLNKDLKFSLVDWGLGDAALYLNESGECFKWCVAKTAADMMEERRADNDRLMIITHSLGSTIAFDTLSQLISEPNPFPHDGWTDDDTRSIQHLFYRCPEDKNANPMAQLALYMFANQYALLTLGRPEQDSLKKLSDAVAKTAPTAAKGQIQLVAFTDPDDLLSFPVASQHRLGFRVSNVYLPNNSWSLFGEASNPLNAHTGYFNNNQVIHIIRSGIPPDTYPPLGN